MGKICIDFFEFQVLVEASWHAGTILRHSIMKNAINHWYHNLNEAERKRTHEFFARTKDAELEIQKRFMARYNPATQYKVEVRYMGEDDTIDAYLFNGKYWTSDSTHVNNDFIIKTEKAY
jgi:hypothetical protein